MLTDAERSQNFFTQLTRRSRRNRNSPAIRTLVRETNLLASDLLLPLFVREGRNIREPINAMPEVFRLTPDLILQEVREAYRLGIRGVLLFPVINKELKDSRGSQALVSENLANRTIAMLKQEMPDMCLMIDIALDPYTSHGHDGLASDTGEILNDETVEILGEMACRAAAAGVDIVAPSDMMDGRIAYIRQSLDREGFQKVGILAYSAKYASGFYGPFREALSSTPAFGDKKSYQMDPANVREALLASALNEQEGADMLMVKPALPYLDVIAKLRAATQLPICAYHVSGEYAMVMAAAKNGWIDGPRVMHESLLSIKRAGADFIATYAAMSVARCLIAAGCG